MQGTWVQSLGLEYTLEKGMATHHSYLENFMDRGARQAYSSWGHKESDMTEQFSLFIS